MDERGFIKIFKTMDNIYKIKNTCRFIALASFTFGTILVLLFAFFRSHHSIIIVGIYYICAAVLLNLILFVSVFISALYFWQYRLELFAHGALLLINIPVAIGYFFLVLKLAGL